VCLVEQIAVAVLERGGDDSLKAVDGGMGRGPGRDDVAVGGETAELRGLRRLDGPKPPAGQYNQVLWRFVQKRTACYLAAFPRDGESYVWTKYQPGRSFRFIASTCSGLRIS
jgi:hypothetical protein